jgi:cell division protease FtsH
MKKKLNNTNNSKNFLIWIAIFGAFLLISNIINQTNSQKNHIDFSDFLANVKSGYVISVSIASDNSIEGKYKDNSSFTTQAPNYPNLIDKLEEANVRIKVVTADNIKTTLISALISWLPFIIIILVWVYFVKKMGKGSGNPLSFAKSKAKMYMNKDIKITFKDIAGIEEAKEEIMELVEFLKDPQKFKRLGGKIPKGCLLIGNPGTGKTLLAKAIAGEAKVPFFSISGSDFVEMFVGVGASRVRDLFEQGKKNAPCIIFIDEIDAVGRHRGVGVGGGNDEREQTLNQLLVEMDGFQENEGVIILAATNRADVLDKALLRPGRFDRQINVPNPDVNGRKRILEVHAKNVEIAPDVDLEIIARGTPGFAGAELQNLVNEAALHAARHNKKMVTMKDFDYAKDRVLMGAERKSMVMKEEEKKLTAYHEAGHAIVTVFSAASDPIHKATIMPRGAALGMVMRLPEDDKLSVTYEKLKADLAVAMGGRVAEEIIFGAQKITTGASSDIEQATKISKMMVTRWGMCKAIGPVMHEMSQEDFISNDKANLIDEEVKKLVEEGYDTAKIIIKKHIEKLHLLAESLIKYETLSGTEVKEIIAGKKILTNQAQEATPKKRKKATS